MIVESYPPSVPGVKSLDLGNHPLIRSLKAHDPLANSRILSWLQDCCFWRDAGVVGYSTSNHGFMSAGGKTEMATPANLEAKIKQLNWKGLCKLWAAIQKGNPPGWEGGEALEYLV